MGLGAVAVRGRQLRRGGREGPRADRGASRPALPLLQHRLLREPRRPDTEAIEHLRRAIEMWDGCREMAKHDSDLDAIRDEPAFQALVG